MRAVAITGDGARLASLGERRGARGACVSLWTVPDGVALGPLPIDRPSHVTAAHAGRRLAVGGEHAGATSVVIVDLP